MRRGVIELGVVVVAVALTSLLMYRADEGSGAGSGSNRSPTPIGCGLADLRRGPFVTSHGICPGMTAERVHAILGPPPKSGPLQVKSGQGRWEEYGTPGPSCTWEGHPSISYAPDHTVMCILGTSLEVAGGGVIKDDDLTSANTRNLLGREPDPVNPLAYNYHEDSLDLDLVVFPSGRKHVAYSSRPAGSRSSGVTLSTPSPHVFRTSSLQNTAH